MLGRAERRRDGTVPEIIAVSAGGATYPGPLVDHIATTLRLR